MMLVETDDKSGFCFGVQNAVGIAEKALLKGEKVYSLGPIVHNDMEVNRLAGLGLITIDREKFGKLKDCNLLIRAHGEPPSTYLLAEKNNITIIDATCPIVKRLQLRIKNTWLAIRDQKGQIVIYGKQGHDEVVGLLGQTNNEAILISGPEDLSKIDFSGPVSLFSQTTMSRSSYDNIAELIRTGMKRAGISDTDNFLKVHNTICGQVSGREPHLRDFAKKHDIIIFVSGKESSNGKLLYNVCKMVNPETYFVSSPGEIERSWFEGRKTAGICGATSTPKWLIEEIRNLISNF
ncbi:MAG TPA: 4-hydroxy-3-methylbut-2-enyl diphosphate reductase [Bacteroidales bacterium]|nr:4-hydroxy-3-methylbut-2-enyl diphosphate reductase [Bacteroidales bacterium]HOX73507.1 4-hydroxy-3-methylbut-2-enyl diphosphate reductase [Bacteroidales bacterium]HPM87279.1 4-hydroxy-3-methylbut-2-enyl diphosphate reductase [Bacteroidales bacterium]HQM69235.1 4-hydroxy-3-methylbut-2-enyl diphosphate reductase [Bacteroidales bacterium]